MQLKKGGGSKSGKPLATKDTVKSRPGKGRNGDLKPGDERLLWGRAGGRCQRCNFDLSRDPGSWRAYNLAENAHVVASAEDGVRGNSADSSMLAESIENHLLLCRDCHKVIDDKRRGEILFPTESLLKLKGDQEALVKRLMDLAKRPQSVAVFISAAVGQSRLQPLVVGDINSAIVNAGLVPALSHPVHIDLLSLLEVGELDSSPDFWKRARKMVLRELEAKVTEGTHLKLNEVEHFSLFGMAPIPVLALLGSLIPDTRKAVVFEPFRADINPGRAPLTEVIDADIRQYDRDKSTWVWPAHRTSPPPVFRHEFVSGNGDQIGGDVVVICELSFPSHEALAREVLPEAPLYKLKAEAIDPGLIQAKEDVEAFMRAFRDVLVMAEKRHGHNAHIHLLGALPVSCAIAVGRLQVKGALPVTIYNRLQAPARYEKAITLVHEE